MHSANVLSTLLEFNVLLILNTFYKTSTNMFLFKTLLQSNLIELCPCPLQIQSIEGKSMVMPNKILMYRQKSIQKHTLAKFIRVSPYWVDFGTWKKIIISLTTLKITNEHEFLQLKLWKIAQMGTLLKPSQNKKGQEFAKFVDG